jgi:hypothetical protein
MPLGDAFFFFASFWEQRQLAKTKKNTYFANALKKGTVLRTTQVFSL